MCKCGFAVSNFAYEYALRGMERRGGRVNLPQEIYRIDICPEVFFSLSEETSESTGRTVEGREA